MFTIGTAGHIDHGKSALVEALTGINPDRLPEERERGMTIDLGFAWLTLPSGREISIVDVPGHERFVRNMVAGVGGIHAALFVVAADEGVMPQTREHLAILDLMGIRHGVIALTKADLADEEWIELVSTQVLELVEGTCLDGAPIIPVSSTRRTGLAELQTALDILLDGLRSPESDGRPRLPVDRAFTVAGFGTVVTGTLLDGALEKGMELEVLPSGIRTRVRGIQSHKQPLDKLEPGSRAAVNLAGVEIGDVSRGMVLAPPGHLRPTRLLDVGITVLSSAPKPLPNGMQIALHTGTSEVVAALRLLDANVLDPGGRGWAQLRVREPIAARQGDHFIIRRLSPAVTLGGGTIVLAKASRLRRHDAAAIAGLERLSLGDPADAVVLALERSGPLRMPDLSAATALSAPAFEEALARAVEENRIVHAGATYFEADGLSRLVAAARSLLAEFHQVNPLRPGMRREELRSRLGLSSGAFNDFAASLADDGLISATEAMVGLAGYRVELTADQERAAAGLLGELAAPGLDVPPLREAAKRHGVSEGLLEALEGMGRIVIVAANIGYEAGAFEQLKNAVLQLIEAHGRVDVGGLRDYFKSSRKYCLPLLEYLDSTGLTRRVGDYRVLRQGGGS